MDRRRAACASSTSTCVGETRETTGRIITETDFVVHGRALVASSKRCQVVYQRGETVMACDHILLATCAPHQPPVDRKP